MATLIVSVLILSSLVAVSAALFGMLITIDRAVIKRERN